MNRRSFLRALGFGLPAAGVCAVMPATALAARVAEAPIGLQGTLAIGVLSSGGLIKPGSSPEIIGPCESVFTAGQMRALQGQTFSSVSAAEYCGVTGSSTFPKA